MKKNLLFIILLCITALTLTSCQTKRITQNQKEFPTKPEIKETNSIPIQTQEKKYISIPIYYGTNREKSNNQELYNGKFTNTINYGYYLASIPKTHKKGELEEAGVIKRLLGKDFDPTKYINVLSNEELSSNQFHEMLKQTFSRDNKDQAFIFIHGYNNTFKSSAVRTAQLFYDLEYDGIPIMYSWPSTGKPQRYAKDGKNIEKSTELFQQFLTDIAAKNPNKKLNIIAHSMGNRLLVETITQLKKENPSIKFESIIMAAPDVSRIDFEDKYLNDMLQTSENINLYCSNKDIALNVSRFINQANRLGKIDKDIFIRKPIKTIDISNAGNCTDILSHTCFAQTPLILNDISNILKSNEVKRSEKNGIFYLVN